MHEALHELEVNNENYLPVKGAIQESQIINWPRQNPRLSTTDDVDLRQELKTQTVKFPSKGNINTKEKQYIPREPFSPVVTRNFTLAANTKWCLYTLY